MFGSFDPKLFDDPEFKEDSVREEIIVPILRRLGYSAAGEHKIVRSKGLLHPYVMIGSKKYPVNIIPDYLLYSEGRPGWILDAKEPRTKLLQSKHAEQAYSYAIHPEVRVRFYALCNGRSLVAYDTQGDRPIFDLAFEDFEKYWGVIASVLSPINVVKAPQRYFDPDLGMTLQKLGQPKGEQIIFPAVQFWDIVKVRDGLFTTTCGMILNGVKHIASFDICDEGIKHIMALTDEENRDHFFKDLKPEQPFFLKRPILASVLVSLGEPTQGADDIFVPFLVHDAKKISEEEYRAMSAQE